MGFSERTCSPPEVAKDEKRVPVGSNVDLGEHWLIQRPLGLLYLEACSTTMWGPQTIAKLVYNSNTYGLRHLQF